MTIYKLTQRFEIQFWNIILPIIEEKGPLMKLINSTQNTLRAKTTRIALLIFVWAGVGFVSGLIIGKLMMVLNLF